jgi:lipocalin
MLYRFLIAAASAAAAAAHAVVPELEILRYAGRWFQVGRCAGESSP